MEQIPSVAAARSSRATTPGRAGEGTGRLGVDVERGLWGRRTCQEQEDPTEEGVQPGIRAQGADLS